MCICFIVIIKINNLVHLIQSSLNCVILYHAKLARFHHRLSEIGGFNNCPKTDTRKITANLNICYSIAALFFKEYTF